MSSNDMNEAGDADKSAMEIKALLSKLDPKSGSKHSDRVKRIQRFQKFVQGVNYGGTKQTPEFYDDDIPLLLLGSQSPTAMYDEEVLQWNLYGLCQACGTPSVEHEKQLKRSARHAMILLKYLVIDHEEYDGSGQKITPKSQILDEGSESLNAFGHSFCSITPKQVRSFMRLDLHLYGDTQRGGAKDEACWVLLLYLIRHLKDDAPQPLGVEDVLTSSGARKAFDSFLSQCPEPYQTAVKNAASVRNAARSKEDADKEKNKRKKKKKKKGKEDKKKKKNPFDDDNDDDDDDDDDGDDPGVKKRKKKEGPAMRWEDSHLFLADQAKLIEEAEQKAASKESAKKEKEKWAHLYRDPLGIRPKDFDLRSVQDKKEVLLEQTLQEIYEELKDEEHKQQSEDSAVHALEVQRKAIESLDAKGKSVLPTDPNFDPLLFLTLIHRNAPFPLLAKSMSRLTNKTENQVSQLQNLVRDNFALFVRCADGLGYFAEENNTKGTTGVNVKDRLDTLDAFSESCSYQARKSFKPLLDNTNEVRKVQSALAVLQRVQPILQAPQLMRQHLENGRFSAAVKAYRRVLVVDDSCKIELLNVSKAKAAECAREARRDLEATLANRTVSANALLDAIRDLDELLELAVPKGDDKDDTKKGLFEVGGTKIAVRELPPSTACLKLQSAHIWALVKVAVEETEQSMMRIFEGESLTKVHGDGAPGTASVAAESKKGEEASLPSAADAASKNTAATAPSASRNRWKYDVLDARVIATIQAVDIAKEWLPRLLVVANTAYDAERRRAARMERRGIGAPPLHTDFPNAGFTFDVFVDTVTPAVAKLVEHVTFCSLGCSNQDSEEDTIRMSFGKETPDRLQAMLRAPLPSTQSSKCAKELAEFVETVNNCTQAIMAFIPVEQESSGKKSKNRTNEGLMKCLRSAEDSLITVEQRRCIYAFDVCARNCAMRASSNGVFDGDALLECVRNLAEELTRPEECSHEVEKGCELVVRRSCEGLANFVRDRGDSSRLRAVAECSDAIASRISDVVKEVAFLTHDGCEMLEEVLVEEVMALEAAMFEEFLDNVRETVLHCAKIGKSKKEKGPSTPTFPSYLSSSLLAIVRCRAQVERALGESTIRRSEGVTYQYLAMATAADGVVDSICTSLKERMSRLRGRKADRYANELQFLMNTLKAYLSEETMNMAENCRRLLTAKSGKGGSSGRTGGEGPEGMAVLEELERLGRVYVLCLQEQNQSI